MVTDHALEKIHRHKPYFLPSVNRLRSGPNLVGRIGSGVQFNPRWICPMAAKRDYDPRVCLGGGLHLLPRLIHLASIIATLCEKAVGKIRELDNFGKTRR